jgi:hypothetical protein
VAAFAGGGSTPRKTWAFVVRNFILQLNIKPSATILL